jgi:HEAT repeat protein
MDSTSTLDGNGSPKDKEVLALLRSFQTFEMGKKEHAISSLQSMDRASTIKSLLRLLGHADPEIRSDAAEALMRIDAKQGTTAVLQLLSDTNPDVRWYTCGVLYDFGDERATPRLVKVLLEDPEGYVRLIAAHALGNVGDLSAVPSLSHAAQFDTGKDYEGRRVSEAAKEAIESIEKRHS